MLVDAFEHHIWATTRLIDTCLELTPEQLDATAPGTYGSILDTQRHIVGADAGYLFVLSGERVPEVDEDGMELELALQMTRVIGSSIARIATAQVEGFPA